MLLREDARFRHLANASPGKTYKQLSTERHEANMKSLGEKYDKEYHGVTGPKPKFSIDRKTRQWWSFRPSFTEAPQFQSQVELQENTRHHAKPDLLRISTFKGHKSSFQLPAEPFKGEPQRPLHKQESLPLKITRTAFHKYRNTVTQNFEVQPNHIEEYKRQAGFAEIENHFRFKPDERLL